MKKLILQVAILFFMIGQSAAQEDVVTNIGTAMKANSAKELVKFCNHSVEIQVNGKSNTYSKPQAEVILRDFFQKNISTDFRYIHQGSSPEGFRYTIGKYSVEGGSFRVYMLLKKQPTGYLIDTLSFTKE